MNVKKPVVLFALLWCTIVLLIPFASARVKPAAGEPAFLEDDFDLQFTSTMGGGDENTKQNTLLDVWDLVENMGSFIEPGYSVYVGSEVPQENNFWKRHYRLSATYMWVYYDHDTFNAGDMFLKGFVNQQIDDQMTYTTDWVFDLGQWNDNDYGPINCMLFDGWAYDLYFWIELYDDDVGLVDTFGTWKSTLNWTDVGTIYVTYSNGDAVVKFTLEVLEGPYLTSAADLLDAYKPYLFSDVETIHDAPADSVYGRVIEGYDSVLGYNATCLQYLYHFPYEYTGSNHFVHYWDWEMVLIFIDYSQSRYPYRLVWDNGFYFAGPSGYDWIDGQEYRIFDENLPEGEFNVPVEFSEQLWPLLGRNRTMKVTVTHISSAWDPGVEKWGWFEWGMPTFQATIDTSYHQFDLGDAGGTDPMDMNRNYPVLELTDEVIKSAYETLDTSFSGGVHELDGYYTPNYAPFSWDVSQPFKFPYLFNNYEKLAIDINAYYDAKERKSLELNVDKKVDVVIDVPCHVGLELPQSAAPGEATGGNLNLTLDESKAMVTIIVWYQVKLTVNSFYWSHTFTTTINETITINLGTNEITFLGQTIRADYNDEDPFSWESELLGGYCSIQGTLNPKLVGTILDATFSVHISEIIKALVGPTYEWIVDFVVDDLALNINPVVTGYVKFDLSLGGSSVAEDIWLTSTETIMPVSFTMPEASTSPIHFAFEDLRYGVNFAVDWTISLEWATIPSFFLEDQEWYLGTWPNVDVDLAEGTASLTSVAQYEYSESEDQWLLTSGMGGYARPAGGGGDGGGGGSQIAGYPLLASMAFCALAVVVLLKKKSGH
ncbi:MAG: hypothetical protein Kow0069_10100 [Promethearchaeota archaeon]